MVRVDRKIWGPGPSPGSRVVVAYPGDDIDEAVLAELEGDTDPEPEPEPAPKPATARRKRATKRKG